jgi:hypothetical protein
VAARQSGDALVERAVGWHAAGHQPVGHGRGFGGGPAGKGPDQLADFRAEHQPPSRRVQAQAAHPDVVECEQAPVALTIPDHDDEVATESLEHPLAPPAVGGSDNALGTVLGGNAGSPSELVEVVKLSVEQAPEVFRVRGRCSRPCDGQGTRGHRLDRPESVQSAGQSGALPGIGPGRVVDPHERAQHAARPRPAAGSPCPG